MHHRATILYVGLLLTNPALSQGNENPSNGSTSSDSFTTDIKQAAEGMKGFFGGLFDRGNKDGATQQELDPTKRNPPPAAGPGTSTQLDSREQVRMIQAKLAALGYDPGPQDGLMGTRTQTAIQKYQRKMGLPVDGSPSASLLQSLSGNQAPGSLQAKGAEYQALMDGSAATQEANDYEGALHDDDYICKDMVDEFKVTASLINIFKSGTGKAASWFEKTFTASNTEPTPAGDTKLNQILKEARLTAKRTNWMPLAVEQRYGNLIHQRRLEQAPEVISRRVKGRKAKLYRRADALLAKLLEQIPEEHPYEFTLFLTSNADANAEAIPGGYLYLSTGALDKGVAELILGHEITHVTKRHTTRELQARLIDSLSTVDDIKDLITDRDPKPETIIKHAAALKGRFLNYSRQQELQADACTIRLASRLPEFDIAQGVERYISQISSTQEQKQLNSSEHPGYPERKERMLQAMQPNQAAHEP